MSYCVVGGGRDGTVVVRSRGVRLVVEAAMWDGVGGGKLKFLE